MHTLYIIGNGFDLMHLMKSSYKDFRQWLIDNCRIDYIKSYRKFFLCPKERIIFYGLILKKSLANATLKQLLNGVLKIYT